MLIATPGSPSLYPEVFTITSVNIIDTTSVKLNGTTGGYIPGGQSIMNYRILYRKLGDTDWSITPDNEPIINTDYVLTGLEPATEYEFRFVARTLEGYYEASNIATGHTGTEGFFLITDCEDLQAIQDDLNSDYELGNDIDCSDTINWNGGAGFLPIGYLDANNNQTTEGFSGVFAGNNYKIHDLHIDTTGTSLTNAIFAVTGYTQIQDVTIENLVQRSDSLAIGGGIIAAAFSTNVVNTHVINVDARGTFVSYGGLIGSYVIPGNLTEDLNIRQNSFTGSVYTEGSVSFPGLSTGIGGLIGMTQVYSQYFALAIDDNYANFDMEDNSTGVLARGGIIGSASFDSNPDGTTILMNNVYASGLFSFTGTYSDQSTAGGLVGIILNKPISITNSFAHLDSLGATGAGVFHGGIYGVSFDQNIAPLAIDMTNAYYDADLAGVPDCDAFGATGCTAIIASPTYFYNNNTNPPLNSWDFTNVWQTTSTLPIFGQSVTQTVTEIPSQFLNDGDNSSGGINGAPPLLDTDKHAEISSIVNRALSGSTDTAPNENPGLFEQITNAIKDFVRNIPEPLVRAFPYLLFGLVSGGVLLVSMETRRQMRHLTALRRLIAKQRSIAQQRDTFWHLAANYLRAPVTLLMGGAELLTLTAKPKIDTAKSVGAAVANKVSISKTQATTTKTISTLVTRIQTKVASIMEDIEGSETLRGIAWPKDSPVKNALQTIGFWASIAGIILLLLLANYIMVDFRGISPSTIEYLTQTVLFGLVAYAIYWALNGIYGVRQNVATAEKLIAQQSKALSEARGDLVGKAASSLSTDVTALEGVITKLPKKSNARQPLSEGAGRLRNMIDSFQLLQAAEANRLTDLSPAKATSDIDTIVSQSLKEERPVIIEKKLAINLPKLKGMLFPGSTRVAKQVVGTVLDNAIAFSPKGSTVDVEVIGKLGMQGILIHDQGPGVSKDQLDHMFEPFTKADGDDALRMNHEGLGIDLYVNRLIMEQLGGKISATSAVGKGTTIQLWWPA